MSLILTLGMTVTPCSSSWQPGFCRKPPEPVTTPEALLGCKPWQCFRWRSPGQIFFCICKPARIFCAELLNTFARNSSELLLRAYQKFCLKFLECLLLPSQNYIQQLWYRDAQMWISAWHQKILLFSCRLYSSQFLTKFLVYRYRSFVLQIRVYLLQGL